MACLKSGDMDTFYYTAHSMGLPYMPTLTPLAPPLAVSRQSYGSPMGRVWVIKVTQCVFSTGPRQNSVDVTAWSRSPPRSDEEDVWVWSVRLVMGVDEGNRLTV